MKKSVKALLTALCAIVLVVATVLGTLAYMTDKEEVVNTFTVGKVDITVNEAPVDADGKETTGDRVTGNQYKLIPGKTYDKDPTMTVSSDSEESYVRMLVTINCIDVFESATNKAFLPHKYVAGWEDDIWEFVGPLATNGTERTYEFRYYKTVDANSGALEPLFTSFTAPTELDSDDLDDLDTFKIVVEGHAIQAEGFENADEAWTAFAAQYTANS